MRRVLYVAHPIRPTPAEVYALVDQMMAGAATPHMDDARSRAMRLAMARATQANIGGAHRWLTWLRRSFPETTFIAPYLASIAAGDDDQDPEQREAGMVDCCAVVERCDGIVMTGGRIGSGGARELDHGVAVAATDPGSISYRMPNFEFQVYDLTPWCGIEGPPLTVGSLPFGIEDIIDRLRYLGALPGVPAGWRSTR